MHNTVRLVVAPGPLRTINPAANTALFRQTAGHFYFTPASGGAVIATVIAVLLAAALFGRSHVSR
jgi:hypothetical protein